MAQTYLGTSGIAVSDWCLGTMTYGNQTPLEDALRQMDMALSAEITFWDTAEMYPVNPVTRETAGRSEQFIGEWLRRGGARDKIQIATKLVGARSVIRDEPQSPALLRACVEQSLRNLNTDVIDLYQIHWPSRPHYHFRRNWGFDASKNDVNAVIAEFDSLILTLKDLVAEGKIRAFGLSNDSAWGVMRWNDRAALHGGPRVDSIQNEYSLMARLYDTDLAEVGVHEQVTLLAYSPLAAGLLTGKYRDGAIPAGSRLSLNGDLGGRHVPRAHSAVEAYAAVAQKHGIDLVHMAMAWFAARPFPVVPIFGATTEAQLAHILAGRGLTLSADVLAELDAVHKEWPMPF